VFAQTSLCHHPGAFNLDHVSTYLGTPGNSPFAWFVENHPVFGTPQNAWNIVPELTKCLTRAVSVFSNLLGIVQGLGPPAHNSNGKDEDVFVEQFSRSKGVYSVKNTIRWWSAVPTTRQRTVDGPVGDDEEPQTFEKVPLRYIQTFQKGHRYISN
jgi:hypothetical protein